MTCLTFIKVDLLELAWCRGEEGTGQRRDSARRRVNLNEEDVGASMTRSLAALSDRFVQPSYEFLHPTKRQVSTLRLSLRLRRIRGAEPVVRCRPPFSPAMTLHDKNRSEQFTSY